MLKQNRTLVEVLLELGKINETQANALRNQQIQTGKSLEELVIDSQLIDENELMSILSEMYQIPIVNLRQVGVNPEALSLVDVDLARRYQLFPFALDQVNNALLVAMVDPLDLAAIQFISQKVNKKVIPHYAEKASILELIEQAYSSNLSEEVTQVLAENQNVVTAKSVRDFSELSNEVVIKQAPIAKIVEQILGFAVGAGASDVHIEPQPNRIRVRYRVDGILSEKLVLPRSVQEALVSRIKILSRMKIDEKRLPQDGRFNFSSDQGEVDLRVSSLPTVFGEKIVMRLLHKQNTVPTLEELGMSGLGLQEFMKAIKVPQGIILVTGPTGSGKTTTLYSTLDIVNTMAVNILTVEDPVEYEMTGISQVQVNNQAGLTFASCLRSFLRQDPDIIMVGEIRDSETAALAVQASMTGHLVFSTLHTNSAAGAIPRLIDMGSEPFLLASSINLIMAQRVLRRLNHDFCEEYVPSEEEIVLLKNNLGGYLDQWLQQHQLTLDQLRLKRPKATNEKDGSGYKGRIAIFEVMAVTPEMQSLIVKARPEQEIEQLALRQGTLLMKQDGLLKVLEGITTIKEVLRVAAT